jgi:fibronectin type 3 domain-containing protein
VTSVANERPLIESAVTAEHEVDYQDRFAPVPPHDLVALPEPGRVRLLWDAADDASEYRIYRQDPVGEFRLITLEPVVGSEYLDRELERGQTYRYFVVAVDSAQNQSEASDQVEARVP